MSITYVTKETLQQMIDDLNQLKGPGRSEIAKAIAEAREKRKGIMKLVYLC
jgi:transcription elongation factor GreA